MSSKLMDNKRRVHAAKVLLKTSQHPDAEKTEASGKKPKGSQVSMIKEQYEIIRDDLLKLRDDLNKGYDMAKSMMNKKTILDELSKIK